MSSANPLLGAPRIHGELLKLGIEISQATVANYMVRRQGHLRRPGGASCALRPKALPPSICLYVIVILRHLAGKSCTRQSPASHRGLALAPGSGSVPVGHCSALSAARPRRVVRIAFLQPRRGDGNHRDRHGSALALQNGCVERGIGSIRNECLDHNVATNILRRREVWSCARVDPVSGERVVVNTFPVDSHPEFGGRGKETGVGVNALRFHNASRAALRSAGQDSFPGQGSRGAVSLV
jgi:hypothetical protein